MVVSLFATRAIVKRYVQERGTAWVQGVTHPQAGHLIDLARLTGVEVSAANTRRRRGWTPKCRAALNPWPQQCEYPPTLGSGRSSRHSRRRGGPAAARSAQAITAEV